MKWLKLPREVRLRNEYALEIQETYERVRLTNEGELKRRKDASPSEASSRHLADSTPSLPKSTRESYVGALCFPTLIGYTIGPSWFPHGGVRTLALITASIITALACS